MRALVDETLDANLIHAKDNALLYTIEVARLDLRNNYRVNTGGQALIKGGWHVNTAVDPSEFVNTGDLLETGRDIDIVRVSRHPIISGIDISPVSGGQ